MKKEFPIFLTKLPAVLGLSPQEIVMVVVALQICSSLNVNELVMIPVVISSIFLTKYVTQKIDYVGLLTKRRKQINLSEYRGKYETDL